MSNVEVAVATIKRWRADPIAFVRENFGVEPDHWQREALLAFANESDPQTQRIALQACAGPGKSAVMSWCGWHFIATRGGKGHHPNAYALSVTSDNLKDNLWKEFALWRERSDYLKTAFEWTAEKIYARDHAATWWIKARSFSKTADAEAQGRTLSGLHSQYIAYFIDESGDIAPPVLRTAEQGLGNCVFGKIVQAGNPTSHTGMLYEAVKNQAGKWTVIRITGDPDDPARSARISAEWARDQINQYGRDNAWVMAFVLGKFPPSTINTLLSPDDIYASFQRSPNEMDFLRVQKRIGIDVARFGDDRTVLFPRQGLMAWTPDIMRNARGHDIAARVAARKAEWKSEAEFIDDTGGFGATAIDAAMLAGLTLSPVNFSGAANDPRYYNRRSEMHFLAADWVKRGGALPRTLTEIVGEATAATYWFEGGKLRIEEKDQIKTRLRKSPDLWDAFVLTFAMPDMPAQAEQMLASYGSRGKMAWDYDPLERQVA